MATEWTIEDGNVAPGKSAKYDWRVPNNDQQHVSQTVTPGALLIKPKDITLIPTLAPKRSGIQHGSDDWDFETAPLTSNWYSLGDIV